MRHLLPLSALLLATACQVNSPAGNNEAASVATDSAATAPTAQPSPQAPEAPATPTAPAPTPSAGNASTPPPPHVDPVAPTPPAEASAMGAARRLQAYCDAVATKRYRAAYGYWSDGGKATGMTFDQFRDSFAKYAAYDCHIGPPGDVEGAAGSAYVTIPLQVTGALTKSGGFLLEGPVTMRRVNDVDGSTAEQRRWHLSESGLKPRP